MKNKTTNQPAKPAGKLSKENNLATTLKKKKEAKIDKTLADTFPASDSTAKY